MTDFLRYLLDASLFQICLAAMFFWIALIFLFHKLYKYAALSAIIFFFLVGILAVGPLGQHFAERIRGKREPTFKMLSKEQIEEQREKIRRYRDNLKN